MDSVLSRESQEAEGWREEDINPQAIAGKHQGDEGKREKTKRTRHEKGGWKEVGESDRRERKIA